MIYTIDIGGSSIKIGILEEGKIIDKDRLDVPTSMEMLIQQVEENFNKFKDSYQLDGMAISAPGSVAIDTGIIHGASALPFIHGPNFKEIFSKLFEIPVEIENDANCAALAEAHYGKYKDAQSIGFVVIGSGVGGSLVYKKEIIHGAHLYGGEIGYAMVGEQNGKLLNLSDAGAFVGLLERCKQQGLSVQNGKEVFALAEKGNAIAIKEIDKFYRYLAVGIYNLQYTFDPEVILIAGAVSSRKDILDNLNVALKDVVKQNPDAQLIPKVEQATFEGDSNLIGAFAHYTLQRKSLNK